MRFTTRCCLLAALLSSAGCGIHARSTAPAPGTAYVATRFCGFLFDGRTSEARFTLDLTVERPLPAGSMIEVVFENPLDRDKPLVVTRELNGDERELRILSTPVKGITQREYAMVARVYASRDKTTVLATHNESCRAPFGQGDVGIQYR